MFLLLFMTCFCTLWLGIKLDCNSGQRKTFLGMFSLSCFLEMYVKNWLMKPYSKTITGNGKVSMLLEHEHSPARNTSEKKKIKPQALGKL